MIKHLAKASIQGDLAEIEVVNKIYQTIIRPVKTEPDWRNHLDLETSLASQSKFLDMIRVQLLQIDL